MFAITKRKKWKLLSVAAILAVLVCIPMKVQGVTIKNTTVKSLTKQEKTWHKSVLKQMNQTKNKWVTLTGDTEKLKKYVTVSIMNTKEFSYVTGIAAKKSNIKTKDLGKGKTKYYLKRTAVFNKYNKNLEIQMSCSHILLTIGLTKKTSEKTATKKAAQYLLTEAGKDVCSYYKQYTDGRAEVFAAICQTMGVSCRIAFAADLDGDKKQDVINRVKIGKTWYYLYFKEGEEVFGKKAPSKIASTITVPRMP